MVEPLWNHLKLKVLYLYPFITLVVIACPVKEDAKGLPLLLSHQ